MCGELIKKTQTKKGSCKGFDKVKVILDAINPKSEQYNLIMDKKEFVLKF